MQALKTFLLFSKFAISSYGKRQVVFIVSLFKFLIFYGKSVKVFQLTLYINSKL